MKIFIFVLMSLFILSSTKSYSAQIVISVGKPATSGGYYSTYAPSNLVDGYLGLPTWNSGGSTGWAQIDLEESVLISKVILYSGVNRDAYESFTLSLDGSVIQSKPNVLISPGQVNPVVFDFPDTTGRVLRMSVSTSGPWVSATELEVYIDRPEAWNSVYTGRQTFVKNWKVSETDQLYSVFTTTHTSYKPASDSETWYYINDDYSSTGAWGDTHVQGDQWVDKYGFKHINIDGVVGLTTSDKADEWNYLAKAGYSQEYSEDFNEDWDYNDIESLYAYYLEGQNGTASEYITIDGQKWYYTDAEFSGHDYGDYWVTQTGEKYIYLGTALTTDINGVETVPEPLSILLLGLGAVSLIKKQKRS